MKYLRLLLSLILCLPALSSNGEEVSGRFAPPEGNVLVFVGQDNRSVGGTTQYRDGYVENIGIPAGVSHYVHFSEGWTNAFGYEFSPGEVPGLKSEAAWGAGPMHLKAYLDSPMLDRCGIHLSISLAGGGEQKTASGEFDHLIVELAELVAAHEDHPFYIRIGHELGVPGSENDPETFREAFRRVVDALRVDQLPNVAIIYAAGSEVKAGQFEEYDPGSQFYDWIGYSWWGEESDGRYALEFARKVEKPVFITEATPRGRDFASEDSGEVWSKWFDLFFNHIETNLDVVRAISYINCDWESQEMWEGWGMSRIENAPDILQRWRDKMNAPMYINSVDKPFTHIGFPAPYSEPEKKAVEAFAIYKNPEASIEERVEDLISKMTLDEKIAQLTGWWDKDEQRLRREGQIFDRDFYMSVGIHGLGVVGPTNLNVEEDIRQYNALQDFTTKETRLGIPALRYVEATHGVVRMDATSFPSPIALSCSWNPDLIEKVYQHTGKEAGSRGLFHVLSPNINLARDPRFGQIDETLGEDPFLVGRLGSAMVRGLQGSDSGEIAKGHVAATLKHFAGSSNGTGGRYLAPYNGGRKQLLDFEAEPFRYIIEQAKPAAVMPGLNEVEGSPCHINQWLIGETLRDHFEFPGLVVSGEDAIHSIRENSRIGASDAAVTKLAIEAGVQLELPENTGFQHLASLVDSGEISRTQIESAVKSVLSLKFRLGLFESPRLSFNEATQLTTDEQTAELVLESARQSIVLLKNDGLLPLDSTQIDKLAVIGPNSDVCRLGSSSGTPAKTVSLLDGLRAYLDGKVEVTHAKGCMIALNDTHNSYLNWRHVNDVNFVPLEDNLPLIEEAVQVASEADVVILNLGENAFLGRKSRTANHLGDRASLDLSESQNKLLEEVLKTGKPVIVYLSHGRPITLGELGDQSRAILTGHYNGQETGTAAAEVLFGETNPSGKLTVSWPQSVSQLPIHYNQHRTSAIFGYIDSSVLPKHPFGHGLSYTSFEYTEPVLSKEVIHPGETVDVNFEITNTGSEPGIEIAQLYVSGEEFAVARPGLELKGFQRVSLKPGETKNVTITLDADDLHFYDHRLTRVLPKGRYQVRVGSSSQKVSNPESLETRPKEEQINMPAVTSSDKVPDKPNILFVAFDDLRPEIGAYGSSVKTPNIDRLAESGMRFDRAYCQQAVCGASRLSVMSGLYPTFTGEQNFHVTDWRDRHPDLVTLNQHFDQQGYETIGLGKVYHDTSGTGVDFDNWSQWFDVSAPEYATLESIEALRNAIEEGRVGDSNDPAKGPTTEVADVEDDTFVDGKRAQKASSILYELGETSQKPFFMALGFSKPHLPFVAPKKYWDLYNREDFEMPLNRDVPPGYPRFAANLGAHEMQKYSDFEGASPEDFSDEMNQRLLHGYAAATSYVDACFGQVMETLNKSGLADNTIVVLWGDHGWKLGDHSSWCKHTNFECDTRVPLIIHDPRSEGGRATTQLVELIDLYPTLCRLAGIEVPAHCQGKSFHSLLQDPETIHRDEAYSSYPTYNDGIGHSIRYKEFRYTEWVDSDGNVSHRVLTDLKADPGEETNLVGNPAFRQTLKVAAARLKARIEIVKPDAIDMTKTIEEPPLEQEISVDFKIGANYLRQTIDGFGGSIAFHGTAADDEALQIAVNGLNTNIVRARGEVDANGDPQHNREILARAMDINPDLEILLTFWQPRSDHQVERDYWLNEIETDTGTHFELKPERETEWAIEIITRTKQYVEWGINVTTIGVQNRSNLSLPNSQTCRWEPERLADFIETKLNPGFNAVGLDDIKIAAPDLANLGDRATEVDRYIPVLTSPYVNIVSYQMYDHYTEEMEDPSIATLENYTRTLSSLRLQHFPDKRLWMTETTGAHWNSAAKHTFGWRPDMTEHEKAIKAARYLHSTLVDAEANAFLWWGLVYSVAPEGETDPKVITRHRDEGLILVEDKAVDGRQQFIERTRKYYTFRQYSSFVKPGYRRIDIESPEPFKLSAFLSPDKKTAIAIAINDTDEAHSLNLNSPGDMRFIGAFQTDEDRNCSPIDHNEAMPPQSVRTMIFRR